MWSVVISSSWEAESPQRGLLPRRFHTGRRGLWLHGHPDSPWQAGLCSTVSQTRGDTQEDKSWGENRRAEQEGWCWLAAQLMMSMQRGKFCPCFLRIIWMYINTYACDLRAWVHSHMLEYTHIPLTGSCSNWSRWTWVLFFKCEYFEEILRIWRNNEHKYFSANQRNNQNYFKFP